jgi:hypothetical protein
MKKMNPCSFLCVELDVVVVHELPSSFLVLRHVSSDEASQCGNAPVPINADIQIVTTIIFGIVLKI